MDDWAVLSRFYLRKQHNKVYQWCCGECIRLCHTCLNTGVQLWAEDDQHSAVMLKYEKLAEKWW